MKKIVIIVALVMFLKPVLPVAEYLIRYDYMAKVLCENKAKPEMKCNGKCQLMKNLAKAAEDDKPITPDKKSQVQESEVLFFQELPSLLPRQLYVQSENKISNHYSNRYFYRYSGFVFHPPTFSA